MSLDGDALYSILEVGAFLIGGLVFWSSLIINYKARLRNEEAIRYDAAKALATPKPWNLYLQTLEATLDTLTRWMGKRARLTLEKGDCGDWDKSIGWCVTLAMIYPFVLLIITWLIGGSATIGQVVILQPHENSQSWPKSFFPSVLACAGLSFYFLYRHSNAIREHVQSWLDRYVWKCLPRSVPSPTKFALRFVIRSLLFAALLAVAFMGLGSLLVVGAVVARAETSGAVGAAFFLALAGAVALAISIAGPRAWAKYGGRAGTYTCTFFLGLAVVATGSEERSGEIGTHNSSATLVLFLLLLPFANALFDWASWQVSRWLGDNLLAISKERGYPRWKRAAHYLKDIVIDGGFALLCLIGLAWTIPRIIEIFNALMLWLFDESIFAIDAYLCAAAKEPLGDGFWATSMLFSTLLPTTAHLAFLVFAPIFWGIAWLFGAHLTNRARAAHLVHGTRPPKKDIRGDGRATDKWPRAMPENYGADGLREDQAMFEGPLNETTLHAITMQLRVWRPLYYIAASALVLAAIWYAIPPLVAAVTAPFPELLLWIAHNGDWSAVQSCFPDAAPIPPLNWRWF